MIDYKLRIHSVPAKWRTEIVEWDPHHRFADRQLQVPCRQWYHTHTFTEVGGGTRMLDEVRYEVPLGPLGDLVDALFVRGHRRDLSLSKCRNLDGAVLLRRSAATQKRRSRAPDLRSAALVIKLTFD